MNTLGFSSSQSFTLSLLLIISLLAGEFARAQSPGTNRDQFKRARPDLISFLETVKEETLLSELSLSSSQLEQIEKLRAERSGLSSKSLTNGEYRRTSRDLDERGLALLNETQKSVWEKHKSELVIGDAQPQARDVQIQNATTVTANKPIVVAQADTAAPPARPAIPDEKPPEGAIAVSSFGTAAKPTKAKTESADGTPGEAKLSFNFRYAAWADVLKLFADVNDLTLDLNDVPPGTFNYYDDRQYSMTEALDVINGYLYQKGYILVRRDRFLVCLNLDNPIPPNVIPNITEDELPNRGKNELLSLIIPLEGLDAEKMAGEVKDLLGPQGKASAMKSTNSLVLTDIGSYLQRVSKLLKSGKPVDTRETAFRAIALKHITAAEAERTVRRLFSLNPTVSSTAPGFGNFGQFGNGGRGNFGGGFNRGDFGGGGFNRGDFGGGGFPGQGGPGQGGPPAAPVTQANPPSPYAGKIQVTADTRTNHLLVTASASLIKIVEEVVKSLDTNTDATGKQLEISNSPVFMKTYSVPGSDASAVSRMLNTVMPGVVVGEDQRAGKVYIQGTKEEHAEVLKILKESAGASSDVTVIPLLRLDPSQVTNTLRSLYLNETTRAPSIEADATNRRILVRGTADQLSQIRTLLREMGEAAAGDLEGEAGVEQDRGTMRRLNLGNHNAEEVLNLVEKSWEASGRNRIRVVYPSRPSPIKDLRVPNERSRQFNPDANDNDGPVQPQRQGSPRTERQEKEPTTPAFKVGSSGSDAWKLRDNKTVVSKRPTTTQLIPRRLPVIPASQISEESESATDAAQDQSKSEKSEPDNSAPQSGGNRAQEKTNRNQNQGDQRAPTARRTTDDNSSSAPVGITVMGNELIITSSDTKALDQLEEMVTTLLGAIPNRPRWTVFYLKSADATETAQMLERLFPQSSVTSPVANDGMFGSLTNSFSTLGRGMLNATGLSQTLGGAQNMRIITDVRANALFITGPQDVLRDVESMLELLDATELPQSGRDRLPRSIPVNYADVDEVAEIIESVFKDSMGSDQAQQGQQQFNPLAAMFGGNRGGPGGAANSQRKPTIELQLGVDRRTSHLIVSCNETLYGRIENMVKAIDERARDAHRTVRLVELKTADPLVVQSTLTSLIPKVTVSATRSNRSRKQTQNGATPGQPTQTGQAPDATRDPQVMQRVMEQQNAFPPQPNPQSGRGGNQGGGGFPFGRGGNGGGGGRRGGN